MKSWYDTKVKNHGIQPDEAQIVFVNYLDQLLLNIKQVAVKKHFLFFSRADINCGNNKVGLYVYGSVGRGKSMILAQFIKAIPDQYRQIRWHFHEFMQFVQQEHAHLNAKAPLDKIARKLKSRYDLIYLDEFEVLDIATAMLIGNLFRALKQNKVFLIMSSNTAPAQLYLNGLMRQRFLPAIEFIEQNFAIYNLNGQADYRYQQVINPDRDAIAAVNYYPKLIREPASPTGLENAFRFYAEQSSDAVSAVSTATTSLKYDADNKIWIQERYIYYRMMLAQAIWFDCAAICNTDRSVADYYELCRNFTIFMITDVIQFDCASKQYNHNYAIRFSWLIDVLYDERKILIISSKFALNEIYINDQQHKFKRTLSRLNELLS